MTINVHFNVSVTSRDLQTSRLGLVSVSAIDVSCPSLLGFPLTQPSRFSAPFVKRLALCYQTVVCPVCLSVCLSV